MAHPGTKKKIGIKDMWKPEDDIDRLMKEKGCDRETAWSIIQERKEKELIKKSWEKEKIKPEIEKAIWFYTEKGFSVIPIGVNKSNDLKKPSIEWEEYHDRKPTREEIQEWINKGLFRNLAVVLGAVSDNLVQIDIDSETIPEEIGLDLKEIWKTGGWVEKTAHGYHIWIKHHGNPGGIKKPLGYDVEFRANFGYCVVTPSMHPDGIEYSFMDGYTLDTLPELVPKDAKAIFNHIKEAVGIKRGIKNKNYSYKPTTINTRDIDTKEKPECVKIALQKKFQHPNRYYVKYGIVSSAVWRGVPKEEARKELQDFDKNNCEPPEGYEIVNQAVDGAYKADAHLYGCEYWMDGIGICPYENIMDCPYGKKKAIRELTKRYHVFKWKEIENEQTKQKYMIKVGVNAPNLAKLLINEYDFHFMTLTDTKEIMRYDNETGCYKDDGELIISRLSEEYMGEMTKQHYKEEIIGYIRDYNHVQRNIFLNNPNLINFKNGVYNMETRTLMPHSPDMYISYQIPHNYNDAATCPNIDKFFSQVTRPDDLTVIYEVSGYCFYTDLPIQKSVMLVGCGANGKGIYISLLKTTLGIENICSISLSEIANNRFAKANFYNKLANLYPDLSNNAINNTGEFKMLTGGDVIECEKKFKDTFKFMNYAKMISSANQVPYTQDDSDAFYRRWVILIFPYKFVETDNEVDNETTFKRKPFLLKELTTEEEIEGFIKKCIDSLHILLERGQFINSKTTEEIKDQYQRLSNPIQAYVKDTLEINADCYIDMDDLYADYKRYAELNKLDILPKGTVTTKLGQTNLPLSIHKLGKRGNRRRCWVGARNLVDEAINHFFDSETLKNDIENEEEGEDEQQHF